MPEPRDTETVAPEPSARPPWLGWRLLWGAGWLVFFFVVVSITYILLVLAGH
jgi:hypothetical protein